jgi:integrase
VTAFCREMGQIPEKRVRDEFMKLNEKIGCPEFTRAHDLRHLFTTRAQEAGMNPLLVQELLGHSTLDMTRRYTHIGTDAKREAMLKLKLGGQG